MAAPQVEVIFAKGLFSGFGAAIETAQFVSQFVGRWFVLTKPPLRCRRPVTLPFKGMHGFLFLSISLSLSLHPPLSPSPLLSLCAPKHVNNYQTFDSGHCSVKAEEKEESIVCNDSHI